MKPGHEVAPGGVDPLAAVVGADAGDPPVVERHVAVSHSRVKAENTCAPVDHGVGLGVAACSPPHPRVARRGRGEQPTAVSQGVRGPIRAASSRRAREVPRPRLDRRPRAHRVGQAHPRVRARRSGRAGRRHTVVLQPARDRQRRRRRRRGLAVDADRGLPLDVSWMAPSCVPRDRFMSARGRAGDCARPADGRARAGGVMDFPGVIAAGRARQAVLAPRGTGTSTACAGLAGAGRLRRRRHPDRPRGVHRRRGAREAPARHVGADPRGLQRPQPDRAAGDGARARAGRTARSAPTTASPTTSPRGPHRRDVPGGGNGFRAEDVS